MAIRTYSPPGLTADDINLALLQEELVVLGNIGLSTVPSGVVCHVFDIIGNPAIQAVIDAHDKTGTTSGQSISAVQAGAKAEVQAIPNYATWTTSQANSYIETNVTDLASSKVVLKALANMVIAMRNELYPDLQD